MPLDGTFAPGVRTRGFLRGAAVLGAFLLLTAGMTWPWVTHLRDAAVDAGDTNIESWILWWDYHQTFADPLHLFDGNIFFPAKRSLAFSEHSYGVALPFFPAFAAGLRPLTVHGLAVLLAFAFSGFGAWRLTKTLTGSSGAAWVAGIAFAFTPYRFHHLTHVTYMFAGWIPLVLEALVLFLRDRTRRRAAWLGVAFFMNGLTCVHWFVLTLVPLVATFLVIAAGDGTLRERRLWTRAAGALVPAGLALLPFMLPYQRAAEEYGFVRTPQEALRYSATWIHWLTVDWNNKLWTNLGAPGNPWELCLFPGLLVLLLGAAALLPAGPQGEDGPGPSRRRLLLGLLDLSALLAGAAALLGSGLQPFRLTIAGHRVLSIGESTRALSLLAVLLLLRLWIARPRPLAFPDGRGLREALSRFQGSSAPCVGLLWALLGLLGSFGLNGSFHTFLWDHVRLFQAIRAPARWAMVAHLGLAVLAGAGALALARRSPRRLPGGPATLFVLAGALLLFELRAAPLPLIRGEVDPDELALHLRRTTMKGGLVELPATVMARHAYVLRAADHGRPLVDAVSGFTPPHAQTVERESEARPLRDGFLSFLEEIPTSYLVLHESLCTPEDVTAYRELLGKGLRAGRLRFVRRFTDRGTSELYAVTRNEPDAAGGGDPPWAAPSAAGPGSGP